MASRKVNGYGLNRINSILESAQILLHSTSPQNLSFLLGTLYHHAPKEDLLTVEASMERAGIRSINSTALIEYTLNTEELLNQVQIAEDSVDLLLTVIHSREGLGAGRRIVQQIAKTVKKPFIHYSDEMYSSQGALAEMLGINEALGTINGKRIAISWGFGNRFISPNIAHSLQLFLPYFGVDLKVVAPSTFETLNRVKRDALKLADECGSRLDYVSDFEGAFDNIDLIIAMNWASLESFQKPGENEELASEYRDWFYSDEVLPDSCRLLLQPPAQRDLIASRDCIIKNNEINDTWLSRRIAILVASLLHIEKKDRLL